MKYLALFFVILFLGLIGFSYYIYTNSNVYIEIQNVVNSFANNLQNEIVDIKEEKFNGIIYNNPLNNQDLYEYLSITYNIKNNTYNKLKNIELLTENNNDIIAQFETLPIENINPHSQTSNTLKLITHKKPKNIKLKFTYYIWGVLFSKTIAVM